MMCKRLAFLTAAISAAAMMLLCPARSAAEQDSHGELSTLLQTISFEVNSATIEPSSFESLDGIAALFMRNHELRYEIQGHTDAQGNEEYNMRLSVARAMSVRNYIVKKGVPAGNVIAIGYGTKKPIADNTTAAHRAVNRRVEVVLIESEEKFKELKNAEAEQRTDNQLAEVIGYEAPPAVLKITTNPPGTAVKINGRDYGLSPVETAGLEPGTYTVELSNDACFGRKTTIQFGSEDTVFNLELVRKASLRVTSEPAGARIILNDQTAFTAPAQVNGMRSGEHKISATMDGYYPTEKTVNIAAGSSGTLHIVLEPEPEPQPVVPKCNKSCKVGKMITVLFVVITAVMVMGKL